MRCSLPVLCVLFACPLRASELRLEVRSGEAGGRFVPVRVEVPAPGRFGRVILEDDAGREMPCQWEPAGQDGKVALCWIEERIGKEGVLKRKVRFTDEASGRREGIAVTLDEKGEQVRVASAADLITIYHFSQDLPKPFCHPVLGPGGKPVTRAFPMKDVPGESKDHPHHRSWYFTFGAVNGIDFWAEGGKRGRIVHAGFERLVSGPVFGQICARNDWISPEGKKVAEDVRSYRFYNVPGHRLIDWEIRLRATEGPVTMGDTKEGMAAFRVATSMEVKKAGRIENSNGAVNERECWGKRAEWCDYSGPVGGGTVGIAFMDHPTSFRHPTYWMVRDYGLFAANPFGLKKFLRDPTQDGSHRIPKGGEIVFRYRIYIHEGDAARADVAGKYADYVHPPVVTVKAD